jgi:endo-1,4-beta-mannosidase
MAEVPDRNAAWVWSSTITNAIRAADSTRPVISGMHSLTPQGIWAIEDQGEITDLLTTHPYPLFTHNCANDPVNTIRSILHAAAESRYYSDIGGKPCFVEEMGTLNNMIASEEVTAMYVRASLFTQWAHDCRAFLWWCGFDQYFLTHAPYDWCSTEGELGLVRVDGSKKPVFNEVSRFAAFLKKLPFRKLPERIKEAVCILSDEQDNWSIAYNSFILAKQAGIDIEFQYETQPVKEAGLYIVPSISGLRVVNKHRWQELLAKVNDGAVLYISHESGLLDRFEELTGVRVETRQRRDSGTSVNIGKVDGNAVLHTNGLYKLKLNPVRAEILGTEEDGNPVFTCASYGKGWVYFLTFPMELELANRPGSYEPDSEPYYVIYKHITAKLKKEKVISKESPFVGVTEHPVDLYARIVVAVNYRPEPIEFAFGLDPDWKPSDIFYGGNIEEMRHGFYVNIPANEACVFKIEKKIIHASVMSIDK